MAGRRGVENDVIITTDQITIGQEGGELIESGDFSGAGAGELLLDAFERLFRQDAAHRTDNVFAICRCGFLRIDLDGVESGDTGDRRDAVADLRLEHLAHIGGGVGADQEDLFALVGEAQRRGASERGFADASLARKEHEFRQIGKHRRLLVAS